MHLDESQTSKTCCGVSLCANTTCACRSALAISSTVQHTPAVPLTVAGFQQGTPRFKPKSGHVGFLGKLALLQLSPSTSVSPASSQSTCRSPIRGRRTRWTQPYPPPIPETSNSALVAYGYRFQPETESQSADISWELAGGATRTAQHSTARGTRKPNCATD
jgi:hypothetical protein